MILCSPDPKNIPEASQVMKMTLAATELDRAWKLVKLAIMTTEIAPRARLEYCKVIAARPTLKFPFSI
jgi:hypothetical protein